MKAKMVQRIEGRFVVDTIEANDVSAWGDVRGMATVGFKQDPPRARIKLRPELIGWPILAGMAGPMWDGDCIRYEDAEANDILST